MQGALCFNKEGDGLSRRRNVLSWAALRCHLKCKGGFEGIILQTALSSTLLAKASLAVLQSKKCYLHERRDLFAQSKYRLLLLWSQNICFPYCCLFCALS